MAARPGTARWTRSSGPGTRPSPAHCTMRCTYRPRCSQAPRCSPLSPCASAGTLLSELTAQHEALDAALAVRLGRWSAPGREDAEQGDAEVHREVGLDVVVRLAAPRVAEHARVHDGAGIGRGGVDMAGGAGQCAAL